MKTPATGCCGTQPGPTPARAARHDGSQLVAPWILDLIETPVGPVPRASTRLARRDRLGAWRVRWGFGRMSYSVEPGLYAVGRPTAESPVFVSANYKLSFDRLRAALDGVDGWILVLDTHGVNVWCAAGKGTFGTVQIYHCVEMAQLAQVVDHRELILPQLGAPGVSAHQVRELTGFRVIYGPVRAADIPAFLRAGKTATTEMRRVRFPLRDRLAVVPVDMVAWGRLSVLLAVVLFGLAGLGPGGYDVARALAEGPRAAGLLLAGWLAGAVGVPLLLPWLPGRTFSLKGAVLGIVFAGAFLVAWPSGLTTGSAAAGVGSNLPLAGAGRLGSSPWLDGAAWLLLAPALAAFVAMNFTGASTFTSLSGVKREMRIAVPLQIAAGALGLALWVAGRFVR